MRSKPFFSIALATFVASASAQCWMKATMTMEPTYLPAQFVIGDKAYFPCGWRNGTHTNSTYIYNSSTDQWSKTTDFAGEKRLDAHGFAIGNKGFVALGEAVNYKQYSEVWSFDPTTSMWVKKNDVPFSFRSWPFSFSINNFGYLGTGYNSIHISTSTDFWRYDPLTDAWTQLANMPGAGRMGALNFVINGMAYVGLGELAKYPWTGQSDFYSYDPATNTWDTLNTTPFVGAGVATFVIKNKAYGWRRGDGFWEYNPANDTWTKLMDCVPHDGLFMNGFSIYDKGYLAFGQGYNWSLPNQLFEYVPPSLIGLAEQTRAATKCYPNPAADKIFFETGFPDHTQAEIFDNTGKKMKTRSVSDRSLTITDLNPGFYTLVMELEGKKTITHFIKE